MEFQNCWEKSLTVHPAEGQVGLWLSWLLSFSEEIIVIADMEWGWVNVVNLIINHPRYCHRFIGYTIPKWRWKGCLSRQEIQLLSILHLLLLVVCITIFNHIDYFPHIFTLVNHHYLPPFNPGAAPGAAALRPRPVISFCDA